ncbi:MAG: hypothetical protein AAGJ10_03825 [Bacteroidota bacterium]
MTTTRWNRLRALFDELADLTIQARSVRIAEEQLDAPLRHELLGLLAAHDHSATILDQEPPGYRLNGSEARPR